MIDRVARERAVIALLEEWPWRLGATLIGGYAVAAYGAPRYSNDVDVIIPEAGRTASEAWLREHGFKDAKGERAKSTKVSMDAPRFAREEVTLDLLVGYVRDREAKVDVPETWISLRRNYERLDLMSGRLAKKIPIARPEALWALKLQAGRDQDLTDLFVMSTAPVNTREVRHLFESLMTPALADKLRKVERRLSDENLYGDSRSRLGLTASDALLARWRQFQERVARIIPRDELAA